MDQLSWCMFSQFSQLKSMKSKSTNPPRTKIDGAKTKCKAMGETHFRQGLWGMFVVPNMFIIYIYIYIYIIHIYIYNIYRIYIYIHWMYVRVYIAWALLLVCPWKAQWIWRRRRVLGDDQGNRKKDRVYNLRWSAPEAVWGHHTSGYKSHSFHDQPSLYVLRGCLNDMKI